MTKHTNRKPLGDHAVGYCRTPESTRFPNQAPPAKKKTKPERVIDSRQIMHDFFTALEEPVVVIRKPLHHLCPPHRRIKASDLRTRTQQRRPRG